MVAVKKLRVELGERSYEIVAGAGLLAQAGKLLQERGLAGKVLVVTNTTVAPLYLEELTGRIREAGFETATLILPDGEEYKTLAQVEKVYDAAVKERLERSSAMVALGGGVIGDLAGFAAASYLRGSILCRCPQPSWRRSTAPSGRWGVNTGKGRRSALLPAGAGDHGFTDTKDFAGEGIPAGLAKIKHALIMETGLYQLLSAASRR